MVEIGEAEIEAVAAVIRSGQLFRYRGGENGECSKCELELCAELRCKHSLLVNSGTSALICALVACDIGPGDEVIIPAFTFIATAMAVAAVGAVPIIVEINETLTMDPDDVANRITPRTRAIIPVHMCGFPCDMDRICTIAKRHSLRVIEDACQSIGGTFKGQALGTIGDAGALSFNQFKIIGAGEGGALLTNDRAIYEKAVIHHDAGSNFRSYSPSLSVPVFLGENYRVSEITGAILRVQIRRLGDIVSRLRERNQTVRSIIGTTDLVETVPSNDVSGEAAQVSMFQVSDEKTMRTILRRAMQDCILAASPLDSKGHVYMHWTPVLNQLASNNPKRNAYNLTDFHYQYDQSTCPKTLSILGRTFGIGIDAKEPLGLIQSRAASLKSTISSLTLSI